MVSADISAHEWPIHQYRPQKSHVGRSLVITTTVLLFKRAQNMDSHTVAYYITSVSTHPTLRGVKHCTKTCSFFYAWCVHIVHMFYYTIAILMKRKDQNNSWTLEHKIGIDLTASSTLKKPSKNYTFEF